MKFLVVALLVAAAAVARAEPVGLGRGEPESLRHLLRDRSRRLDGRRARPHLPHRRRRRDLGAAGRRHQAALPRHELPRPADRLDRRQGRHRLRHDRRRHHLDAAASRIAPPRLRARVPERASAATAPATSARMVHTEDGGATWTRHAFPTEVELPESALDTGVDPGDVNLYGLSYGDPDHVWVVGEFGTIMASSDGGHTWKQQHAPIESTLFGVHFTDAQHGWAVGIDSVILRTEDGGATWTPAAGPVRRRPSTTSSFAGSRAGSSATRARCSRAPTAAPPGSSSRCRSSSPPTGSVRCRWRPAGAASRSAPKASCSASTAPT